VSYSWEFPLVSWVPWDSHKWQWINRFLENKNGNGNISGTGWNRNATVLEHCRLCCHCLPDYWTACFFSTATLTKVATQMVSYLRIRKTTLCMSVNCLHCVCVCVCLCVCVLFPFKLFDHKLFTSRFSRIVTGGKCYGNENGFLDFVGNRNKSWNKCWWEWEISDGNGRGREY